MASAETTASEAHAWKGRTAEAIRGALRVLPFFAAAALFAHFAWYGLRPALVERARLDSVEREIHGRHVELIATEVELSDVEAALSDEIYRERLRRLFARERLEEQERRLERSAGLETLDPTWFGAPGEAERLTVGHSVRAGSSSRPTAARRNGSLVR